MKKALGISIVKVIPLFVIGLTYVMWMHFQPNTYVAKPVVAGSPAAVAAEHDCISAQYTREGYGRTAVVRVDNGPVQYVGPKRLSDMKLTSLSKKNLTILYICR